MTRGGGILNTEHERFPGLPLAEAVEFRTVHDSVLNVQPHDEEKIRRAGDLAHVCTLCSVARAGVKKADQGGWTGGLLHMPSHDIQVLAA